MTELIPGTEYGPLDGRNYENTWEDVYLQAHLLSDIGRKRSNNEDSCLLCSPRATALVEERGRLFAVADGMGGASAGEHASRMALHILVRHYFQAPPLSAPEGLLQALQEANEKVYEEAEVNPVYSGMGTTVSAAVIHGEWVYVAQVGDSRVYLLRERSGIHQLTHDHSLVAEQVRSGLISEEEARTHSLRNLITRAVGIKEQVKVDLFAVRLEEGDTLLLCSDGLSNMVSDKHIAQALADGDLKVATRRLVGAALDGGGADNITAVTIRVIAPPPKTEYQEGAKQIALSSEGLFKRFKRLFS